VCFLSEANLIWKSIRPYPHSCLVIDIGSTSTTVYPIYSDYVVHNSIRYSRIGGEHITAFLTLLLHNKQMENYSSLLPRRCKEIAMELKEHLAFVAPDFEQFQETYGTCAFEARKVMSNDNLIESYQAGMLKYMPDMNKAAQTVAAAAGASGSSPQQAANAAKDLRQSYECKLPDGTAIGFTLDIELFHCTEVLFNPDMFEGCSGEMGLIDLILEALDGIDESVRADVCSNVIIGGGSCVLPGLQQRLDREINDYHMLCPIDAEDADTSSSSSRSNIFIAGEGFAAADSVIGTGANSCTSVMVGASYRVESSLVSAFTTTPGARSNSSKCQYAPIEPQNFVTSIDYESRGSADVSLSLIS
jgi:hypothetical protein